ncbi:E3 ubiquitin-protein ligase HERC2-like [Gorilla gorilla gorilla]|uniref:E3 ubiquitin-protein ligase HERC2-like n=1 Tax=Gorilla gorilla gorilla TaxID=9595 RepID=UPI0030092C69
MRQVWEATSLWRRLRSVRADFLVSTEPSLKHALLNQCQKRTTKIVACFVGPSFVLGSVQGMSPELSLCLVPAPSLIGVDVFLNSLKQTVVTLASSADVLSTVPPRPCCRAAGPCCCPPPRSRPGHSALLPCGVSGNEVNISPGRRFVIDLLVGSLMAAGGLESALHAAITAEIQDVEAKKEAQKEKEIDEQEANVSTFHRRRTPLDKDLINTGICESSGKQCLPLVQLIQQLLR